jgi:hypothetical protein
MLARGAISPASGRLGDRARREKRERRHLDELLEAVRGHESRTLVIVGEPGVGETALLEYAVAVAPDFRVQRAVAVESEMGCVRRASSAVRADAGTAHRRRRAADRPGLGAALAFAARRVSADWVGILFAARGPSETLAGVADRAPGGPGQLLRAKLLLSVVDSRWMSAFASRPAGPDEWTGWRRRPARPGPTGRAGSRRAHERC